MRFYVKGTDKQGQVWYVHLTSEIVFPESLTAHQYKACEFNTMAGADIGEACRMASQVYGFQFYPEPVATQLDADEFRTLIWLEESIVLNAWLDRMERCTGSIPKALLMFSSCCNQVMRGLPAFRNVDVVDDFSIRLGHTVLMAIELAERGTHELSA